MTNNQEEIPVKSAQKEIPVKAAQIEPGAEKKIPIKGAIILALTALLIISLIYFTWPETTDCGYDKQCFMEKANACKKAILRVEIADGTIVKYTSKGCSITKIFEEFSKTEVQEVIDFLKAKEMKCDYKKGQFNILMIEDIAGGLEYCKGELKDAIIELRSI